MILYRQLAKRRAWWTSRLCEQFEMRGLATIVCAKRLFSPAFNEIPANDRDHLPW